MKTKKILAIVALILCFATALVSCGNSDNASIDDIFNPEYEEPVSTLTTYRDLGKLGETVLYNDAFVVFEKENNDGHSVYRVYSNYTNSVVQTYTAADGRDYEFDYSYNFDRLLFVFTETWDANADPFSNPETKLVLDLLDTKGNVVLNYNEDTLDLEDLLNTLNTGVRSFVKQQTRDLIEIKNGLYRVAEDGTITLMKQFPFTDIPEIMLETEDYFYAEEDDTMFIYDKEFKLVNTYRLPSYAEGDIFLLDDGNLLVQYKIKLPEDATNYDVLYNNAKYTLVTQIVSAKTGEEKDVKGVDFVVNFLYSKTLEEEMNVNTDKFSKKYDNLASIHYINKETKKIDRFKENYVFISNSGKVKQNLKISDQAVDLPTYLAKGLYSIHLKDGNDMIVDSKGMELAVVDSDSQILGSQYIVTEDAIYTFDGTKVYDLIENKAEVVHQYEFSVLLSVVRKINDVKTKELYLFIDGEVKKIAEIGEYDNFYFGHFFKVYNSETKMTSFYNQKGDLIVELDSGSGYIGFTANCYDGVLIQDVNGNYHKFIFDVIPKNH